MEVYMGEHQKVSVVDIQMPFLSMVLFLVKISIAAIPAMIILAVLWAILIGTFGALFGGMRVLS
jgi:hypothetical protein